MSPGSSAPRVQHDVAPEVHLISHAYTNCYVVTTDTGVLLVDAGYPATWNAVQDCLRSIDRDPADIEGLLLTHGHFDHLGFAARLRREHGVPVWAHPADGPLLSRPYAYRPERARGLYPLRHPGAVPVLAAMVRAGALRVPPVVADHTFAATPVPGLGSALEVIHTPGHTDGSVVLVMRDRSAVFTGDALVTLDPYTGRGGPRIVARAATHDRAQALESLRLLRGLGVNHLLPGHGPVWLDGVDEAVDLAISDGGA